MKIVKGYEQAREALLVSRALSSSDTPRHVQIKTEEVFGKPLSPSEVVQIILENVKDGGDEAIIDLTVKLEGVRPKFLEVSPSKISEAFNQIPQDVLKALNSAATRISKFHSVGRPESWFDDSEGYGETIIPVNKVGIYVPGGTARLPSTVLMTATPAKTAGVSEIILCTPSSKNGTPDPLILAAAKIAGVDKVFQIGGAQAIAAMAYGTNTVPRVDMVCGPGNIFVTLAKKHLFGEVGLDGLFGPTETLVIADEHANATLCAADLVAQAEHDYMATPILITTSHEIAIHVEKETKLRASNIIRSETATSSLDNRGYIAVVEQLDDAFTLANEFSPEHISLMIRNPKESLNKISNAGAIFLGDFSHEVLGDYIAGPSHVMPTGGTARFASGLNVRSFLKVSPVVGLGKNTALKLGKIASTLGRAEGLTGHAEAAEIREELDIK